VLTPRPAVTVFPLVLSRVPCLPVDHTARSTFEAFIESHLQVDEELERLARRGKELADDVGSVIPRAGRQSRARLLGLRRNLHNARAPGDCTFEDGLPPDMAAAVADWWSRQREVRRCQKDLAHLWASLVSDDTASLGQAANVGPFAAALRTANPELVPVNQRTARAVWSLRWRAAYRPTPWGLYCGTSVGALVTEPRTPDLAGRRLVPSGLANATTGDSVTAPIDLGAPALGAAIADLEWFGTSIVESEVRWGHAALSAFVRRLGAQRGLDLETAVALISTDGPSGGGVGGIWSGLARHGDQVEPPALAEEVASAWATESPLFGAGEVPLGMEAVTTGRRAALRLLPIVDRLGDGLGVRVTFWGEDRMSFFPRYVRPGSPALDVAGVQVEPAAALRDWFGSWPDAVELDDGCLERPALPWLERRIVRSATRPDELAPIDVFLEAADDRVQIRDRVGRPVDPVYLGVTAPHRLPGPMQLLLTALPAHSSAVCAAVEALNWQVLRAIGDAQGLRRLPPLWLTDHVQLCPSQWLVPSAMVPVGSQRTGSDDFLRFHRWAARCGLPRGLVHLRGIGGRADAQPVHLGHPAGVDCVRRMVQHSPTLLVTPIDTDRPPPGSVQTVRTGAGAYYCEHAMELRGRDTPYG